MYRKKKRLSAFIAIRLFLVVIISFVITASVSYALQLFSAKEKARELLRYNNMALAMDVRVKADSSIYESSCKPLLDIYIKDGKEALKKKLAGTNYSYLVKRDGTIIVSGNDDFMGMNVGDIPGVADAMDIIVSRRDVYPDNVEDYKITPYPVKTLDGKKEVYYAAIINWSDPDVMLVCAIDTEIYHEAAASGAVQIINSRSVGIGGFQLVIGGDYNVETYISDFYGKPFTYTDILEKYDKGDGQDINYEKYEINDDGRSVELDVGFMFGRRDFWDTNYFYCLHKQYGCFILSLYPSDEALSQANDTIVYIILIEVIVFTVLFTVLYLLIKLNIVMKLSSVNTSLARITEGNLDEKIDVRDTYEFDALSTDINATVDKLKEYIAQAAARIDEDLEIAKAIQTSVLPNRFPPFPDQHRFELFASMQAAKEVGGDFYDFYMIGKDTLGFLIADVSGKSIPGAMFMMTGKAIIKSLAESGMPPAEVFSVANEKLCEGNDAELFITAWMGYLDLMTGEVHVANAGHNPPVLIRNGKAEYVILKPGLMLAGMEGLVYKDQIVKLEKGDILYLYTDGVTEAMDADEEQYGDDRLQKLLSFGETYPEPSGENGIAGAVCELVTADIDSFIKGAEQSDDITMLCVRYLGES